MNTNILLESGTNELELLEFQVGDNNFGINISKVVEIMINEDVTPVPNSPEEIEGVFIPRDKLISVIDLHKVVHVPHTSSGKEIFIICEFNRMHVAFHVTSVKGIQRISWADIADPPAVTSGSSDEAIGLATTESSLSWTLKKLFPRSTVTPVLTLTVLKRSTDLQP